MGEVGRGARYKGDPPHICDLNCPYTGAREEHEQDVAERPVIQRVMDAVCGAGNWTALPGFCHIQVCGKQRRIGNAKARLANAATRYVERFRLASAFAPAIAARALQQAASELDLSSTDAGKLLYLELGGEDMPDAFSSIPIQQSHRKQNTVMCANRRVASPASSARWRLSSARARPSSASRGGRPSSKPRPAG